ncbi:MAG: transglutaminase domain-containing protein [Burkholderiaceae bacterium]|nr:transglutaminase domain-containing protein [Burkholderiaceae bacterium]
MRTWRATFWLSTLLALLLVASLTPYLTSSTELVRMRNALLYEDMPAHTDWTPTALPAGWLAERAPPTPMFARIVAENRLVAPGDDWETALRIGRHLLSGVVAHRGNGGAVQLGLSDTWKEIIGKGRGYCGDYVDVFTALANTSGIFSRSWAFSFDGFDGHGHIFNEIWDRKSASWRMIDVFNNYYVVDENERPLSALEFREVLLVGAPVRWRAVEPVARPGYKYPEKAVDYYRRGAREWYLWWGNNVFEYDSQPVVSLLSTPSRSLGQLSAIVLGVYPPIRVLQTSENEEQRAALERLRFHLFVVVALLLPALLAIAISAVRMVVLNRGAEIPQVAS